MTRARIILALAQGCTNQQVAKHLELRAATVSKWRGRFAQEGPAGLSDEPRSGKPPTYTRETEMRVLSTLDAPPPDGYAQWIGSLLAAALGDVSRSQVWRILRVHGISLQRRRSWCVSTDPQFAEKAADVVALYLDPPDNAVVAEYPGREIHVILDNLSTHKPRRDMWLARHRNVHLHSAPTHASWLNQIEVWFSILSRAALKGGSYTSPNKVREAIDAFLTVYNENAHPWRKAEVHQTTPKPKCAHLCR